MRTRCPNCNTLYDIATEALAAADYEARCCRCHKVFHTDILDPATYADEQDPSSDLTDEEDNSPQNVEINHELDELEQLDHELDELDAPVIEETTPPASIEIPENLVALQPSAQTIDPLLQAPVEKQRQRLPFAALAGALILVLVAVVQVVQINYNKIIEHPLGQKVCAWVDCSMPEKIDATKYVVRERKLSLSKDQSDRLQLQLAFTNTATFAQPLPILKLSFRSNRDTLIAQREFTPEEYLYPATPSGTLVQPQETIVIKMQVQDPGEKSAGYELDFLPNLLQSR